VRYPSGKSILSGALVWGGILILIISAFFVQENQRWIFVSAIIFWTLFLSWIWFGTFYKFRDTYILARMGPFVQRIPYDSITSVKKIRIIASSMALSSEAIEICHGKNYVTGTTYISPNFIGIAICRSNLPQGRP
jgi:hypothetical protein